MKTLVIDNTDRDKKRSKAMNVGELIAWLERYDEDLDVEIFWTDGYFHGWRGVAREDFEIIDDDDE